MATTEIYSLSLHDALPISFERTSFCRQAVSPLPAAWKRRFCCFRHSVCFHCRRCSGGFPHFSYYRNLPCPGICPCHRNCLRCGACLYCLRYGNCLLRQPFFHCRDRLRGQFFFHRRGFCLHAYSLYRQSCLLFLYRSYHALYFLLTSYRFSLVICMYPNMHSY